MDSSSEGAAMEHEARVEELTADFRRRMDVMYSTLCSEHLQHNQRAPFLRQLLLRLNFNDFMEKAAMKAATKS